MFLNDREIKILEKLLIENEIKLDQLSSEFNISQRMIRYNIEKINYIMTFLNMPTIERINKSTFKFNSDVDIKSILDELKNLAPLQKNERLFLIQLILIINNKVIVTKLAKYLDVTRITINSDLKNIYSEFEKRNIDYIKCNQEYYKYKIYILAKAMEYIDKNEGIFAKKIQEILSSKYDLNIKNICLKILYKLDIKINNKQKYDIMSRLFILIYDNKYYHDMEIEKSKLILTYEYLEIKKILNNKYSDDKLFLIVNLFVWVKACSDYDKYHKNLINIELFSQDMIKSVEKKIGFNISTDKLLLEFLISHLKGLIFRLKNEYEMNEENIDIEFKQKDRLFYDIKNSVLRLESIFKQKISDEEIYFLKMHFLASIERIKKQNMKSNRITVITDLGYGSQKILINQLKSKFLVEIVYIGPYYKIDSSLINDNNIEYILSTDNLDINRKVLKISPILTEQDINLLISNGLKKNNKKILLSDLMNIITENTIVQNKDKLVNSILNLLSYHIINDLDDNIQDIAFLKEENIVYLKNIDDDKKAINICLDLLKKEYVIDSYIEDVNRIYENNLNYILRYNGVIIPHAKNKNNVINSGIAIVVLDNPIRVKNTNDKIDIIVTFAIKNELKIQNTILNALSKIFKDEFRDLINKKNKENIIKYLMN